MKTGLLLILFSALFYTSALSAGFERTAFTRPINQLSKHRVALSNTAHKEEGKFSKLKRFLIERAVAKRFAAGSSDDDAKLTRKGKTLGLISVIAGGLGVLSFFIAPLTSAAIFMMLTAVITGAVGMSAANKTQQPKKAGRTQSLIGLILGSLGILFTLFVLFFLVALGLWA